MKFKLEIECDNAAFVTEDGEPDPGPELTRILGWVVNDIGNGAIRPDVVKQLHARDLPEGNLLRDINGNTVGSWKLVDDTPAEKPYPIFAHRNPDDETPP